MELWKRLQGHKTNLGLIAAGILGICYVENWISRETAELAMAVIGPWIGIAIRSAWAKGK